MLSTTKNQIITPFLTDRIKFEQIKTGKKLAKMQRPTANPTTLFILFVGLFKKS